jgi:hypothetical protein
MKNEQIISAWDKIEPSSATEARMLDALLTSSHLGRSAGERASVMSRLLSGKRLALTAVCLVAVIVLAELATVVAGNAGWFGSTVYTVELSEGDTLSFYKTNALGAGGFALDLKGASRDLTAEENKILFNGLTVRTSHGLFDAENHSLLRVESAIADGAEDGTENKVGTTKIIFAAPDIPLTDTGMVADTAVSEVNGIPVSAGYFITDANSRGMRNIIYFASFSLGDVSIYVEQGGDETNSETIRNEFASVIDQLTQNGTPNLNQITE